MGGGIEHSAIPQGMDQKKGGTIKVLPIPLHFQPYERTCVYCATHPLTVALLTARASLVNGDTKVERKIGRMQIPPIDFNYDDDSFLQYNRCERLARGYLTSICTNGINAEIYFVSGNKSPILGMPLIG